MVRSERHERQGRDRPLLTSKATAPVRAGVPEDVEAAHPAARSGGRLACHVLAGRLEMHRALIADYAGNYAARLPGHCPLVWNVASPGPAALGPPSTASCPRRSSILARNPARMEAHIFADAGHFLLEMHAEQVEKLMLEFARAGCSTQRSG